MWPNPQENFNFCAMYIPTTRIPFTHFLQRFSIILMFSEKLGKEMGKGIWDNVLENGPSKICGRQLLKHFKGYILLK